MLDAFATLRERPVPLLARAPSSGLAEFPGCSEAFFTTRARVHDSGAKGAIR